ncbi:hypothetical protein IV102_06330 [bacterium]|nr:hypothetical protein [bacterium]
MMISFVTLIIITMLVGAAFTLLPSQLAAADHEGESVLAVAAAASGADYAQSRMQDRPSWRGDHKGTPPDLAGFVVNTPALQIYEDNGNVLGLMVQPDGSKRAFRIRFNYQNGNAPAPQDNLANPAATHFVNIPQVSFNNIAGWAAQDIYSASNVSGTLVVNSVATTESIPKFESAVYVEGLSGPGLRNATIDNLDAMSKSRGVISQVAQVRMGFLNQSRVDSAVYAGGDFTAHSIVDAAVLTSAPGAAAANMRSLANVKSTDKNLNGTNAQSRVYRGGTIDPTVTVASSVQSAAAQNSRWLKMKWSEVAKASSSDTRMKAGTYYWQLNALSGARELLYYPEEYSGTGPFLPSTSPTVVSAASDMLLSGSAVSLDQTTMTTTISDRVFVEPVGGVKGLSFAIDPVYQATLPIRPAVILDADPAKTCILSTTGSLLVQGKIEGIGSITTEGNLKIQGTSLFEADQTDSVVLYAKNDISVESVPPSVALAVAPANTWKPGMGNGKAKGWKGKGVKSADPAVVGVGDVQFAGAVFAMGNFTTNINNGGLYVRGVLSAYGGDPESAVNSKPGAIAGSGIIDVTADRVEFMYDPSYLMNKNNTGNSAAYIDRISWNLLP